MRSFHAAFAWVVVGTNAVAGAWALGAHWLASIRHRALWFFTTVAQVTIFVQVAVGVIVLNTEDVEVDRFHYFYGFVAMATVGIIYSYRAQLAEHRYLLYGLGGLFLMGLALRSLQFADRLG